MCAWIGKVDAYKIRVVKQLVLHTTVCIVDKKMTEWKMIRLEIRSLKTRNLESTGHMSYYEMNKVNNGAMAVAMKQISVIDPSSNCKTCTQYWEPEMIPIKVYMLKFSQGTIFSLIGLCSMPILHAETQMK